MRYIIGVDFDNTLVSYDDVMHRAAVKFGWISPQARKNKKTIRDAIRQLSEGETKWQKLQAFVYGQAMDDAALIDGVKRFFQRCRRTSMQPYIVSHKTEFAAADEGGINLRNTALAWMQKQKFFDEKGLGLSPDRVYFESTRQAKIRRIMKIGCTHFIDDLEETFLDPLFPAGIQKILFNPGQKSSFSRGIRILNNWKEIGGYFFNAQDR